MTENVTVAAAIKELRGQLEDAQRDGVGKDLRFLARSVELELGIVFKTEKEGGGGVKAWFVDVSGKASGSDERVHNVKLVLELVGRDGKRTLVSDAEHEKE
jgi:hypothetical protein